MLEHLEKPRSVLLLFTAITVVKIALFVAASSLGHVAPFLGGGARQFHIPASQHILEEGQFNSPTTRWLAQKPPGYAYLIAAVRQVSSENWALVLVALQMVFDLLTAAIVWFLGFRLGTDRAGALAGVGWLLYPPAALVSTWVAPTSLFTLLLVGAITLLLLSVDATRPRLALASGVVIGLATLVRAAPMAFPVLLLLVAMFKPFPRARTIGVLVVIGTALVVTPWAVRNRLVLDENILVRYGVGMVFMQGSEKATWDLNSRKSPEGYPKMFADAEAAGLEQPTDGKVTSLDRWKLSVGFMNYRQRLQERPGSFVPFLFHKFMRLWYGMESCNRSKQLMLGMFSLLVVPLGLLQIIQWRRTRRDLAWVLGLVLVYFCTLHWVLLAHFRYLLPAYPFLALGAATWLLRHAHRFTLLANIRASLASAGRGLRESVGSYVEPRYAMLRDDTGSAEVPGPRGDEDADSSGDAAPSVAASAAKEGDGEKLT